MAESDFNNTLAALASAGTKLSVTLYSFSETISTDHRNIKSISNDVALISSVLIQLDDLLMRGAPTGEYSDSALSTAQDAVKDCEGIFNDIQSVLDEAKDASSNRSTKGKLTLSALERSQWPFVRPGIEVLVANLDRVKSTLVLVLNVLTYSSELQSEEGDNHHKNQVENLVRSNREATRKYEFLLKSSGKPPQPAAEGSSSSEGGATATNSLASLIKVIGHADDAVDVSDEAELTVRACLDRIENALGKIAQSSPSAITESSTVAVSIELEKEISRTLPNGERRAPPRITLSVIQKQGPKAKLQEAAAIARRNSVGRSAQGLGRTNSSRTNRNVNNTWYSTAWNSLPSIADTVSFLQEARNDTSSYFGVEAVTEDVQDVYEPYKRDIYATDEYELPRFNAPVVQATSPDSPTIDYYSQASSSSRRPSELVPEPYAPPKARLSRSISPPYEGKGKQRADPPHLEAEVKASEDQGLLADGDDGKGGSPTEKWNQQEDLRLKEILDSSVTAAVAVGEKAEAPAGKGKGPAVDADKEWTTV